MIDSAILQAANVFLAPVMIVASLWLLVRGHDAVGGGFIGGLTAGAAVVLLYFSQGHQRIWQSRWLQSLLLAGGGLLVALAWGFGGLLGKGSFLAGAKFTLPLGVEVAGSLVFDIGVYGVVIGIVVAILRHLGQGITEPPPEMGRRIAGTGAVRDGTSHSEDGGRVGSSTSRDGHRARVTSDEQARR